MVAAVGGGGGCGGGGCSSEGAGLTALGLRWAPSRRFWRCVVSSLVAQIIRLILTDSSSSSTAAAAGLLGAASAALGGAHLRASVSSRLRPVQRRARAARPMGRSSLTGTGSKTLAAAGNEGASLAAGLAAGPAPCSSQHGRLSGRLDGGPPAAPPPPSTSRWGDPAPASTAPHLEHIVIVRLPIYQAASGVAAAEQEVRPDARQRRTHDKLARRWQQLQQSHAALHDCRRSTRSPTPLPACSAAMGWARLKAGDVIEYD